MKKEIINLYLNKKSLVKRSPDISRANSLIQSSQQIISVVKNITLNEESATIIFRELYESIRELGDAKWWILGYEAKFHEPSIKVLTEAKIKNSVELFKLERFRQIRNDANYRGYKVTVEQAKEISGFLNKNYKELVEWVKSKD